MMTRIVRLALSSLLWAGDRLLELGATSVGRLRPARTVVLYYHAVDTGDRGRFAAQMDALARWATPVPASIEGALQTGGRYAAVTFDDGFQSVIENALPELEARKIPMTFFVPTGSWGQRPSWVQDPRARAFAQTVLTPDQLRRLGDNPWVTIGAHSISHPDLLALDEAGARREMEESKFELERVLGREVGLFSFPHGRCSPRLVQLARAVGYRRVFTISPSWAYRTAGEFVTGRVAAGPGDWPIEFRLKIAGAYRWRHYAHRIRQTK